MTSPTHTAVTPARPLADPLALAKLAARAAKEAGELVRDHRPDHPHVVATKSSEVDIVTEMDRAAERLITERLLDVRPDDGFLGEESGLRAGTSGITWVVDPIDGTVNYLYGLGGYAVSVAACQGAPDPAAWTTLAGCVYVPGTGIAYWAALGHGAFANGRPLAGPTHQALRNALVATGFGYLRNRRTRQARVAAALLDDVRDLRRLGAASVDLCLVADGHLDAYYERGLNPWDHAAGALIAREAGVIVTGPGGTPASAEMLVAAGPMLHCQLLARLAELDAVADD